MNTCKQRLAIIIGLALFLILPINVYAAGKIDLNHEAKLTITANYGNTIIKDMSVQAYLISNITETGDLVVEAPFLDYADELNIRGKEDGAWYEIASKLEQEIIANSNIHANKVIATNEHGIAEFKNLKPGLYLIVSDKIEQDGYVYSTAPFFIMLPSQNKEDHTWNYHVVANAKIEETSKTVDLEVIKIWKDNCHKDQRPVSIDIDLLCDGQVYDSVTLPQEGHWNYKWKNMESNHKWTVKEKQQKGYKKPEITREDNTFIVTNICDKPTSPASPILPQTGQLWWPVPFLLVAGLMFLTFGLIRRRRE